VFLALVRSLASKAKSQTQTPEAPPPPAAANRPIPRGGSAETEEERIRRFLEALGQPPGTTPPKIAPRRREVQPKIFPRVPPLTTAPPPLPPPSAQPPDGRPNERFLIARVSPFAGDHASVRVSGKAFFFRRFTGGGGGLAPGRTPAAGTLVGNRQRDPGVAAPISPGIVPAAFAHG